MFFLEEGGEHNWVFSVDQMVPDGNILIFLFFILFIGFLHLIFPSSIVFTPRIYGARLDLS